MYYTKERNQYEYSTVWSDGLHGKSSSSPSTERRSSVTALVRSPESIPKQDRDAKNLTILQGDALDKSAVASALIGQDAVVQCLGVGGFGDGKPTLLVSQATQNIIQAMQDQHIQRLVCMSNTGVGGGYTPWIMKALIFPLFLRKLRPIMEDKERMEKLIKKTSLDWTIVRFPNITQHTSKGTLRVSDNGKGIGFSITVEDSADFLLSLLTERLHIRATPSISN